LTSTVCVPAALVFLMSMGPRGIVPLNPFETMRFSVKITSWAVTGLPLWKVTPCFSLISHCVKSLLGVIDSASMYSSSALASSCTSGL
jgi:hypothetical protein